jgi:predicted transport protein
MAIFKINDNKVQKLKIKRFKKEKELQRLFESNLNEILGIRFLASEFTTSHGGRIDTLGLDEDGSPVIIEYKRDEKDNVINQGLFYLDWLVDHKGDFEILVQKKLGKNVDVSWDTPRVVLIAQSYNQYDKYAVHRISENIELKRYVLYENNILSVENVLLPNEKTKPRRKKKTKVVYKEYSIERHLKGKPSNIKELIKELRERILGLDEEIKEKVLKHYIAYKLNKNFTEIVVLHKELVVHFDMKKSEVNDPKNKLEDVSNKGHHATGGLRMRINTLEDIDYCMEIVKQSYDDQL